DPALVEIEAGRSAARVLDLNVDVLLVAAVVVAKPGALDFRDLHRSRRSAVRAGDAWGNRVSEIPQHGAPGWVLPLKTGRRPSRQRGDAANFLHVDRSHHGPPVW